MWDPADLSRWEVVLRSDVAVALLLLGFTLILLAVLLSWTRALYRENQELRRELIEYLKANGELNLTQLRRLLDLYQRYDDRLDPTQDLDLPVEPPR